MPIANTFASLSARAYGFFSSLGKYFISLGTGASTSSFDILKPVVFNAQDYDTAGTVSVGKTAWSGLPALSFARYDRNGVVTLQKTVLNGPNLTTYYVTEYFGAVLFADLIAVVVRVYNATLTSISYGVQIYLKNSLSYSRSVMFVADPVLKYAGIFQAVTSSPVAVNTSGLALAGSREVTAISSTTGYSLASILGITTSGYTVQYCYAFRRTGVYNNGAFKAIATYLDSSVGYFNFVAGGDGDNNYGVLPFTTVFKFKADQPTTWNNISLSASTYNEINRAVDIRVNPESSSGSTSVYVLSELKNSQSSLRYMDINKLDVYLSHTLGKLVSDPTGTYAIYPRRFVVASTTGNLYIVADLVSVSSGASLTYILALDGSLNLLWQRTVAVSLITSTNAVPVNTTVGGITIDRYGRLCIAILPINYSPTEIELVYPTNGIKLGVYRYGPYNGYSMVIDQASMSIGPTLQTASVTSYTQYTISSPLTTTVRATEIAVTPSSTVTPI